MIINPEKTKKGDILINKHTGKEYEVYQNPRQVILHSREPEWYIPLRTPKCHYSRNQRRDAIGRKMFSYIMITSNIQSFIRKDDRSFH